jgi:4-hydroxy-2-oxoglutarate aldolase
MLPSIDLTGVLVPAVTPFLGDGELDIPAFKANLASFLAHPIRGIVVGGSTGEAVFLDEHELLALVEAAAEVTPADRLVVAGTGAESTRATIRRSRAAAARGAHALLVQPPAFFRGQMTDERLVDHYRAVADASPIPVIVYQVPTRFSTLEFSTACIATLSQVPGIVGMKDSRGSLELVEEIVAATPDSFQLLVGTGARLLAARDLGAVGGILGIANVAPDACAAILRHAAAGERAAAEAAQARVAPLHDGIVGGLGIPGVKAALDLQGLHGGAPRPPLAPLGAEGRARVQQLLAG